jgi:hypothetical protein
MHTDSKKWLKYEVLRLCMPGSNPVTPIMNKTLGLVENGSNPRVFSCFYAFREE